MPQALTPPDCIQVQTGGAQFQESDHVGPYPSSAPTYYLTSGKPLTFLGLCLPFSEMGTVISKGPSSSDIAAGGSAGKEEKAINAEVVE